MACLYWRRQTSIRTRTLILNIVPNRRFHTATRRIRIPILTTTGMEPESESRFKPLSRIESLPFSSTFEVMFSVALESWPDVAVAVFVFWTFSLADHRTLRKVSAVFFDVSPYRRTYQTREKMETKYSAMTGGSCHHRGCFWPQIFWR